MTIGQHMKFDQTKRLRISLGSQTQWHISNIQDKKNTIPLNFKRGPELNVASDETLRNIETKVN